MTEQETSKIAVVGAGLMGQGIALEFAVAGYRVTIQDVSDERVREAHDRILQSLKMLASVGLLPAGQVASAAGRISGTTGIEAAVADADLVIESVYENFELKQRVFREIDRCSPQRTILASNSSSIPPSGLAQATGRPDKVLVAHYFNPPYLLPLVEIVPGKATSDATVQAVVTFLRHIGKRPVVVRKEAPGFIGNRLQAALLREALHLVEAGIASPEDVDTVIREGFGRRLAVAGIFEVFDFAGWDTVAAIAPHLLPHLESSTEPAPLLAEKVARGELGVKSGKGFYDWTPEGAQARSREIAGALIRIAQWREKP